MADRAPLLVPADIEPWVSAEPGDLAADPLLLRVLWGVSIVVRDAGSATWERETLPDGARLIATLVAKHYYEHPTGAIAEGVAGGPSERFVEDVLRGLTLEPEQRATLADLAGKETPLDAGGGGIFTMSTHNRPPAAVGRQTIYVLDEWAAWPIPYFDVREPLLREREAGSA